MSDIDNQISQNFMQVFSSVLSLMAGFGMVLTVMPLFILWLIPLFRMYYITQRAYRKTAREMKRLNSNARSPIFQHFDETLSGLITIRAMGGVGRFSLKNEANVDYHMRAEMGLNVCQRWLTFRLSSLSALTLFVTTFVITLFPKMMDAGLVGLAMNYSYAVLHPPWPHFRPLVNVVPTLCV
jgi:ABC-type multidrug transport system fused ATPase/permease subunit